MRSIMKKATTGAGLVAAILGSIALAASLSACDNNYPIYGSIQLEKPGSTQGPFYKTTVGKVVLFKSAYYAQRATLISSTDGTTWGGSSHTPIAITGLGTSYFCTGLAATSTALWAVIDGVGLYSSGDGTNWTQVIADPTTSQTSSPMIDNVFTANDMVFVEYHNENNTTTSSADDIYTLKASSDGTTFNPVTFASGGAQNSTMPFAGVAYADGSYWIIAKDGLYSAVSASGSFAQVVATSTTEIGAPPTGAAIDSILAWDSTTLYAGTDAGVVYKRTTGGNWTNGSSLTYAVTALGKAPVSSTVSSTGWVLLAGYGANATITGGSGYAQVDPTTLATTSGDSSAVASNATNYDTTLSGKPVEAFLYDATGQRLFAATASAGISGASGLWTTTWDGTSTWSGWSPIN